VGTSPAPTDTLQAALSIAQHQGNNASQIAGLITANPFFSPSLTADQSAALTDWALAVVYYRGGGLATAGVVGDLMPSAQTLAIDGSGNIWVPGGFNGSNGFLAVFNNQGAPLPISPSAAAATPGGYTGVANPQAIAFDLDGNAWIGGGTTGSLTVMDVNGNVKANPSDPALLIPAPHGIAMDQFGNMWVASNVGNCGGGNGGVNGGSILEFAPGPDCRPAAMSATPRTIPAPGPFPSTQPTISGFRMTETGMSPMTLTTTASRRYRCWMGRRLPLRTSMRPTPSITGLRLIPRTMPGCPTTAAPARSWYISTGQARGRMR
jgi:hypothetical protein